MTGVEGLALMAALVALAVLPGLLAKLSLRGFVLAITAAVVPLMAGLDAVWSVVAGLAGWVIGS